MCKSFLIHSKLTITVSCQMPIKQHNTGRGYFGIKRIYLAEKSK